MARLSGDEEAYNQVPDQNSSPDVGRVPSGNENRSPRSADVSGQSPASVKRVDPSTLTESEAAGAQEVPPSSPGSEATSATGGNHFSPHTQGQMASVGRVNPSDVSGISSPADVTPATVGRVNPAASGGAGGGNQGGTVQDAAPSDTSAANPIGDKQGFQDDNPLSKDAGQAGQGQQSSNMSPSTSDKGSSNNQGNKGATHPNSSASNPMDKGKDKGKKKDSSQAKAAKAAGKRAAKAAAPAAKGASIGIGVGASLGGAPTAFAAAAQGVVGVFAQIGGMLVSAASAVGGAISGFITGVAGFISSVFSVSMTAAVATSVAMSVGFVGAAAAGVTAGIVTAVEMYSAAIVDPYEEDCSTGVTDAAEGTEEFASSGEAGTASQEDMARKVWMLCKALGWDDIHAAGALGNFQAECGLDPTCVEGIYGEEYYVGPKEQAALDDMDNYTRNTLLPMYARQGISTTSYYWDTSDGKAYCGLGMMQWTGPAAERLLNLSQEFGQDWSDISFQIALMFSRGAELNDDPTTGSGAVNEYASQSFGSVAEAAKWFGLNVEGNPAYGGDPRRQQFAQEWYDRMPNWSVDQSYVDSVTKMISNLGAKATDTAVATAQTTCTEMNCVSVGSMPSAAVAMAYATQEEATNNPGTEVYQAVRKALFPDDPVALNESCDRGVAAVVRWSGADMEYPVGACAQQKEYVESSPKWKKVVDGFTPDKVNQLEPGDVFLTQETGSGGGAHTLIYVGPEIIEKTFGGAAAPGSDFCHASYMQRSFSCGLCSITSYVSTSGTDSMGRHYNVYRCVNPDGAASESYAGASIVATEVCTEEEDYEGGTLEGNKIVEAAKVTPWPGASLCATWTTRVYEKAGFPPPYGNANEQYYAYCKSSDRSELMPGMLVAVPTHNKTYMGSLYGHVGIYMGNNIIRHSVTTGVEDMDLDKWLSFYGEVATPKWGWGFSGPVELHAVGGGGGSTSGKTIKVPSGMGSYYTVTGYGQQGIWYANGSSQPWAAGTDQRRVWDMWVRAGKHYKNGIATLSGRYLIAMTPKFGKVGDKVTIKLKNGQKIAAIIADEKRTTDAGANEWGHDGGKSMVEFEVNMDYYHKYGNPGTSGWCPQWGKTSVKSVTKNGSIFK